MNILPFFTQKQLYRGTAVFIFIFLFITTINTASAATADITPGNPQGWVFALESGSNGSGQFVTGPGTPPAGSGSAQLVVTAADTGSGFGLPAYGGTPLANISAMSYSTYRTAGGTAQAPSLQFAVDLDGIGGFNFYQGRLVFEPYRNGSPVTGSWQQWDAINNGDALWWATDLAATLTGCPMSSPCTLNTILTSYPNAGIHASYPGIGFKVGSGWASFDGNVDAFSITISGVNDTYNFENLPVNNITQNTAHPTIQAGINAANPGDVLEIDPGTYVENVVVNRSITLRGSGAGTDPSTHTIINGTSLNNRGISINNNIQNVTIEHLRVQNFAGTNGAGIWANAGNNGLTVQHVHVVNNGVAGNATGGIYINGPVSNVLIDNVMAHNNVTRGIVIWNGLKTNITITNNDVRNNNCCGIELQDGTASGVTITGNTVVGNADSGMAAIGLMSGTGANVIAGNVVANNGRFGIEIKNPNGSGLDSGDGSIVVQNNTVSFTPSASMDRRDLAGIAVYRRDFLPNNSTGYVDVPTGVIVRNNTVSGYRQERTDSLPLGQTTLTSEGFGIVIEGTGHTVSNNTVENNNIGIQEQGGLHPYANYVYNNSGSGDQENEKSPQYFGRGNAPVACGNTITSNTLTGNGTATRQRVVNGSGGLVTNTDTSQTFCTIQAAINDNDTDAGDTIQLEATSYTELVDITKSVILQGQPGTIIYPSQNIPDFTSSHSGSILWIQAADVVIRNLEIDGDNPAIGGGHAYGGADINAVRGIYMNGTFYNNTHIENITLRNLGRGVNLYGGQNHLIQDSDAQNLGGPAGDSNFGYGILLMGNSSATITNNTVNDAMTAGIFMQNNHSASNTQIADNSVTNARIGLGWNMLYGGATGIVENNTVSGAELGMQVTSISNGYLEIRQNDFTLPTGDDETAFSVWNTAPDMVLITDNTVQGGDYGVYLHDNNTSFGLAQAHLQLTDNAFAGTGTAVEVSSDSASHTVTLRATGNNIANGTTGLSLIGADAINSLTFAGNTVDNVATPFFVAAAGNSLAYANNITNFTTGVSNSGGALNARHNWWGAITPAGVNETDAYDYRLGAAVNTWGEGTLGSASLTSAGGGGTGVIISHGRGLANVPFGKGNAPYASDMCSDYYDFFVLNAVGDWTISVPVDAGAACDYTFSQNALYQFALSGTMPDTSCIGGACWELPVGVTGNGRSLQVTLDAPTYLQGTPFAAGDNSPLSNDPTAVSLSSFSPANHDGWGITVILIILLFTITGAILIRRRQS